MMSSLFTADSLISLLTLTLLEIVLGIDNVIFVAILLGRLAVSKQPAARRTWMIAGILTRTALLLGLSWLVTNGSRELFRVAGYGFNLRNLIMIAGGLFLLYKTVKEIHEKFDGPGGQSEAPSGDAAPAGPATGAEKGPLPATFASIMGQIILVDLIFSFDSIVTAVGLAKKLPVMITAVIIAMIIMFFFSQRISDFIHKHASLKMLALSFLLMVGFSLLFEGLEPVHHSHIDKGYIYFAMAFSFGVELLNIRLKKKK